MLAGAAALTPAIANPASAFTGSDAELRVDVPIPEGSVS
jgi:hypothetical protein